MTEDEAKQLIQILTDKGIHFEAGLNNEEVRLIEIKFNFKFPPDLKRFLQTALPTSDDFVNWRLGLTSKEDAINIIHLINSPLEGMVFDLENNRFWIKSWGEKPKDFNEKADIAKKHYLTFPKLIPIYSHRFIPSIPEEEGNPVFSVHQMDIVYYGYDLASYFAKEFEFILPSNFKIIEHPKEIKFWTDWIENEDELFEIK